MRSVNTLIGQPIERTEDLRFLRGRGTYVADVIRAGQLHAVIVRSTVAHGRLKGVDASAALKLPGVHAVITAADLGEKVPRIPLRLQPVEDLHPFHQPVLAWEKVRFVGEPVAVVVADTQAIAEDAHDLVEVDIEPLPPVTTRADAQALTSLVFEIHGSNEALTWHATRGNADEVFAGAAYRRKETFYVQRHAAMFMEPRGFVAEWDAAATKLTVWGVAKVAWVNRRILSAALGIDESQVEMIECDVGGGFGSRGEFYPEDFLVPFASRHLNRPVKWIEDRREHLMCANHAREAECELEIAATREGKILGFRGQSFTNHGAYIRTNGSVAPRNIAQFITGPYKVEHVDMKATMLITNKTPTGTYRGPGRFEGDFFRERLIDLMAKDLGLDLVEVRRRNLVTDAEMPFRLADITPYDHSDELDSGDNPELFERCLKDFGWAEKSKLQGKLIDGLYNGIAICSFIEGGGAGPSEEARMVLETDGRVSLYMGSAAVGQGLETIMAQIAGDALELPFEAITVLHGSTSHVVNGFGSFHSRSTVMGGSAILVVAENLKAKIKEVAAGKLGCNVSEVQLDGTDVRGGGKTLKLSDLSDAPIEATGTFYNKKHTYSYGTQAVHVTVDPGTGQVEIVDLYSVKDCGRAINPLMLHGQAIGSMVQGLGGAFLEDLVYDSEGQILTGSFADYLMPSAGCFPNLRADVIELKPSPINPLGAKGAGEGEIVPIGGLLSNAVANALSSLKVEPMELPLSPPKVWALIDKAKA
ncbi:MAG: xanthine dehydrogenase family protein molybdopterin-binding subunit, partial [Hyphomicrobiaceae bacterium]